MFAVQSHKQIIKKAQRLSNILRFLFQSNKADSQELKCIIRNPLTNEVVYSKRELTLEQIVQEVKLGKESQSLWSQTPLSVRKQVCSDFNDCLKNNSSELAENISLYTGKPLKESQLEIKATTHRMKALIDISEEALKTEIIENNVKKGRRFSKFITKHPVGSVLIISPWNYPLLTASSVLMTSLLAGNNVLLKPSPQTAGIADDLVSLFFMASSSHKNNLSHLVKNVYTSKLENFSTLYKHSSYVSFTGSIATGLRVQKECIEANPWANCVLELGGKDAVYIHKSSINQIDDVVKQIIIGAFTNSGQSCCAVERVYCDSEILEPFLTKLLKAVETIKVLEQKNHSKNEASDKVQPNVEVGPLTLKNHTQFIKKQVDKAVSSGATILNKQGGQLIELPLTEFNEEDEQSRIRGYFPTILSNVNNKMDIMQTETFGPVLPIHSVTGGYKEALNLMNDSKYGLTASIFSQDEAVVQEMSSKLNVGTVLVNQCLMMDPLLPWIGWNQSGKNFSLSKHGFDQVTKMKSHNQIFNESQ